MGGVGGVCGGKVRVSGLGDGNSLNQVEVLFECLAWDGVNVQAVCEG